LSHARPFVPTTTGTGRPIACHAFALPSYREGLPRTCLEAMAVGRAIVASDAPGCREVVVEGLNGRLAPPRDAAALADVLGDLAGDVATMASMGAASRQICEAREVVIVRGAVSADHIHLLLAAPPVLSPAKLAQYIKGRSSRHLQAEFPELRKRYWGQHMWARGYFCATVGAVDEATIKAYIESQKWDEDDQGFKITAPAEP